MQARRLRYNNQVDKVGQTVSATEFAALTGVSRERLRTWERRFGFPRPTRVGHGPRRYAVDDAGRVVAVRRAAEQGVPLARAITEAAAPPSFHLSDATLARVAASAPTPVVVVAGPEPLRVVYANAAVARTGGEGALDALPWFIGSDLERTLRTLFATSASMLECTHPSWSHNDGTDRSIAYRLPSAAGEPPLVVVVGADRAQDRRVRTELTELRRELARLRAITERQERSLALAGALAEHFRNDPGEAILGATADTLVRRLGAVDAGIAVYMAGELALGSSSRGLLGPRMVTVTAHEDIAALITRGVPGWLSPPSGAAFGMPSSLHSLAVPIAVVGETLGVLLLLFDEPRTLDDDARHLLTIVSTALGFGLLRDRLVASVKTVAPHEAG